MYKTVGLDGKTIIWTQMDMMCIVLCHECSILRKPWLVSAVVACRSLSWPNSLTATTQVQEHGTRA